MPEVAPPEFSFEDWRTELGSERVDRALMVRISKLMALGLRHEPGALGLTLDAQGWASVEAVLAGLASRGLVLTQDDLEMIVETNDKRRFVISPDGASIRANQGHSIAVDLGLRPREPPEILFHGTVDRFIDSILERGLLRGARTHVHLSSDERTAELVASRRRGRPVLLVVRALEMHRAGHALFLSANDVWLTECVPARFLQLL
jgi:putative RNA 2'-phosphotransferase